MKSLLIILLAFVFTNVICAPYNGNIMQFKQPNGTVVNLKLFGTEFYMRAESIDGYTLIRDNETGWICYAKLSGDSKSLISTGIVYENSNKNLNIAKHIDIAAKQREIIIENNKNLLGISKNFETENKTAIHHLSGNIKGLCIVVDFSDEPISLPLSEFDNFCNNLTYSNFGNNGSLRTFYRDISGGLVDYQNIVYGVYRAPRTFAEYEQMPMGQGAQEILGLTLNWISSLGFDFSTLTTEPDGSITAINLMYTGQAQNWAQGMWWHQGSYTGFYANGVYSNAYNCSPAYSPLSIATVCHENGHMIGKWPDTYKYNSTTGDDGIGGFDLMCWYGDSYNPVPPNPHFWSNAGWGHVVDVTNFNGIVNDTANTLTCYKYKNLNDTNEFFLLENLQQISRYSFIPDNGLTIWHIDRNGDNQTLHHEVFLEHANNDITNHYDACFHLGFNTEFSNTATPNSDFYNGNPSGLRVWEIGNSQNIMTYKIGAGQPAPTLNLMYVNITNDNNSNGFIESGETADLNINASNFGQINSGSCTVTCNAIGPNSSFVTINNGISNVGIINVSQTVPTSFNVTISPSTPIGTVLDFNFTITDGTYTTYITKSIVVGQQIIINNNTLSTCSALFYDDGGEFNIYNNTKDYTITISPSTINNAIKADFQEFDVEYEQNCVYDYMQIYNGTNTSAPLIGTYCGTNSPGIVTSTDVSGALTFNFHSDDFVTGNGWKAIISCVNVNNVLENSFNEIVNISPNPTSGLITINSKIPKFDIIIFDLCGKEILHASNTNKIDISGLPSSVYLIQVTSEKSCFKQKIFKE